MLRRIRKALVSGVGAGFAAFLTGLVNAGHLDSASISAALGLGAAAAVSVGFATWYVPNAAS
jgi:hypothetical protein